MDKKKSRFQRYIDKFKPDAPPKPIVGTVGEVLSEQAGLAVKHRVEQVLPLYIDKGKVSVSVAQVSFWEEKKKRIVVTVLVEFPEDVVWKDGG